MDFFLVFVGLVMLLAGGEGILRGSVAVAARFQLSNFFVGVVIVGFGTSLPELTVSVAAALKAAPGIALGNVVGSNIANILLILGLTALVAPICCRDRNARRDGIFVLLASVLLVAFSFAAEMGRAAGFLMVWGLCAYVLYIYFVERRRADDADTKCPTHEQMHPAKAALYCLVGLALLVTGADLLVDGARALAEGWGVSNAVIGLTLVAVGTSLPELSASLVAGYRRQSEIALGNILGSNFFNILGVLGVTVLIAPLRFEGRIAELDVWIMLGVALTLLLVIMIWRQVGRLSGIVFLVAYAAYVMSLYAEESAASLS